MVFAADGLLSTRTDRNGNTTQYQYNPDNTLAQITDPVGLATVFVYANGKLRQVTDPGARVSTFAYDSAGNLTRVTFPDGTFRQFAYDDRHLMVWNEDERGNRSMATYDAFGRVIQGELPDGTIRLAANQNAVGLIDLSSGQGTESDPVPVSRLIDVQSNYVDGRGNISQQRNDAHGRSILTVDELGRVTTHVRDADSNPVETTRPNGSVVTRMFDPFGNVLSQTEEFNGAAVSYSYDQYSLVTSVTNPNSHTTTINRHAVTGNAESIVNHLGHTTTMLYESRGLVEEMTSPNGMVTTYTYNPQGLLATKTETPPVGSVGNVRVWTYTYYPTGLLHTVLTPDGVTLTYAYDARSYLTQVTDNLNQSISYSYDAYKNVVKTETTSGDDTLATLVDRVYDVRNRLVSVRSPHVGVEESITQRVLDENSNLVGLVDPNGASSSNAYDPFNRLVKNTHRLGGETVYAYDLLDRLVQVTAPNGVVTEYENDLIGRRVKEMSADRGSVSYAYDLANNVTEVTDGRGITAVLTYDELERVVTKTYPNTIVGKTENVTYTYDSCAFGLGYLCGRSDESGSYTYSYDGFGNVLSMGFTERDGTLYTTGYGYDDGDNVVQLTYPSGRVVDIVRDGVRRVSGIDTTLNGGPQSVLSAMSYRGDNQLLQCTYGNGLIDTRTYDLQGRLTHQVLKDALDVVIDERTYAHDKNSNILSIDTNVEDKAYGYDALDRLTSDTLDADPSIDFSYDLNDNRLTRVSGDGPTGYQYVASSNRVDIEETLITGTQSVPLSTRELVYNNAGRLYQLIEAGVLQAAYYYNDAGQRTRKITYQSDGVTIDRVTIYHYDTQGYLIAETDETGVVEKDYIWRDGMHPVAQIDTVGGTESIVYFTTDHLLTSRLATDDTQAIVWRWDGEAFGNTAAQEFSSVSVNLRFPGQYYDEETNLHYNWHRYYDPELGRYITSDPIGLGGGFNTYLYVVANPIYFHDIRGLQESTDHLWRSPTSGCSFVKACVDAYRDRNSPPGYIDPTIPGKIKDAIIKNVLIEGVKEGMYQFICGSMNECQCRGSGEGGCPYTKPWLPGEEPGQWQDPDQEGSNGDNEIGGEGDGDDNNGGSCPVPDPIPPWSSPEKVCYWDYTQSPPKRVCSW